MPRKKTTEEFIIEANLVHNNVYDYTNSIYIGSHNKINILCEKYGMFEQIASNHINNKRGCSKCNGGVKNTLNSFINQSNKIHNNMYNYNLIEYVNNYTPIKIICEKHNIFEQLPLNHLKGKGCPKCGLIKMKKTKAKTLTNFIKDSNKIHNDKYDYSKSVYFNNHTKLEIICEKHGSFKQTPNIHIDNKSGCPKCSSSKGEEKVRYYLNENNIEFVEQKTFNKLKSNKNYKLKFDFYLPKYNICVEYDGKQHFKIIEHFGGRSTFMKLKHRDKLKNKYCLNNNIKLIRIPYTDFNNIENIILNQIKSEYFPFE